ncbi:hypothetical protein PPERSA_00296 [Pseudocohnilembus persalinus]|uniref:FAD dependent oxidoreductase domain-containing protein n=1 Tax=Pseudocohnilembus persalinus TaxID=266149 RepID=A0A0V0Q9I8_PSEPJ|nr:hypothetical protein PPERSA_00296 [Pseudocohnilembus persalinus]|eukprot:KRW98708.1 hypothetical protein PPERSA_00296 [Pseudocohnilembus persalinus]
MEKKGNFEILTGKHVIELIKDEQNEKIVKGVKCDDGTILNSDYFVFCNNESIRDIVKYPLIRMCGFSWTFYKKDSQNQELIEEVSDSHNMSIGTRCVSPNGVPIVGLLNGFENAFVNTGHGFLGWTLSSYTGKLLSKIVIKQIDQEVQLDEQEKNILKHVSSERYWF